MVHISENIISYLANADPTDRSASFDYCYNYFQHFKETNTIYELASPEHLQTSCLHIGFYLASWGMFRSRGHIGTRSLKIYEPLIKGITTFNRDIWDIDVDSYNEKNIKTLFECTWMIHETLKQSDQSNRFRPSHTLITKIMLGIFGNIPAFDTYFVRAFGERRLNQQALHRIADFYQQNRILIDKYDIRTRNFYSGELTDRRYTKAKIIDMIWFIEGRKQGYVGSAVPVQE